MLDAIDRIGEYIAGVDRADFLADAILRDAVVRQFEILGEAAGRVSKVTCRSADDLPELRPKVQALLDRLAEDV